MKIEKRKRIDLKNLANREKKEICCLKILKIEKRKRNENTILQLEREKHESFLLEIFSRSRLLSMTDGGIPKMTNMRYTKPTEDIVAVAEADG